jgi:hypothetical protein
MKPLGVDVLCISVGLTDTPSMRRNLPGGPPAGAPLTLSDPIAKQALEEVAKGNGPIQVPPVEEERMKHLYSLPRRKLLEDEASSVYDLRRLD